MYENNAVSDYIGKKERMLHEISDLLPASKIDITYETHAGTLAVSRRLLKSNFRLKKCFATELDLGTYSLLKQVQMREPDELIQKILNVGYDQNVFDWCKAIEAENYEEFSEEEIAVCKYILLNQSYNAACKSWRGLGSNRENEARYKKNVKKFIEKGHFQLQDIEIVHGDMMDYLGNFINIQNAFIFIDSPYENSLRSSNLYSTDTDSEWHDRFLARIREYSKEKMLKANLMVCGYCHDQNFKEDKYCKALIPLGFKLYKLKDTIRPTVIRDTMIRKKNTVTEYCWLNYEPRSWIPRRNYFDYNDIFGDCPA